MDRVCPGLLQRPRINSADPLHRDLKAELKELELDPRTSDWPNLYQGLLTASRGDFCEARNFAGCFRIREADGSTKPGAIGLTLDSYRDVEAEVFPKRAWPQTGLAGFRCFLLVATGQLLGLAGRCASSGAKKADLLKACVPMGRFHAIQRRIDWNESAPWGKQTWVWESRIEGHSLVFPPAEDPALLEALRCGGEGGEAGEALDFTAEKFRPLTAEEEEALLLATRVAGTESPRPTAVLLIGPSCSGKTTVVRQLAQQLGVDAGNAVKRDSNLMQDYHAQYAALAANGRKNGGIWLAAWGAVKGHWQEAKVKILQQACANRRDIIMFARGVKGGKRALEGIETLRAAGHTVHVIGVFASPKDLIDRGLRREAESGKRYNRQNILDLNFIADNFRGFAPAIGAANGLFKIVLNANGEEPRVQLEGKCLDGSPVPQKLHEAIEEALVSIRPRRHASVDHGLEVATKRPPALPLPEPVASGARHKALAGRLWDLTHQSEVQQMQVA